MYFHSDPHLIGWLHICYEFSVGLFSCVNLSMYEINSRLPFFVSMFRTKSSSHLFVIQMEKFDLQQISMDTLAL